ncbi:MAG: FecR domain-containing protein [Algibacter sp.]
MIKPKIKKLIVKYITSSISDNEESMLLEWLNFPRNKLLFIDYIQTNYALNYNLNDLGTDESKKILLKKIRKDKSFYYKYRLNTVFKYAALFIIFLSLSYGYQHGYFGNKIEQPKLNIPNEAITLQLDNGKIEILNEEKTFEVKDKDGTILGTQNKTKIVYKAKNNTKKQELVYNTLYVPYGKQFEIQLSEGTNVFLNSGTTFKYPVEFLEGKDRLVYVEGEAFFDVVKDAKHPFIVNANDVNIRVLGTKFNVSSYIEDINVNTVLVEGAVNLYDKRNAYSVETAIDLKPGYKATWNKNSEALIEKVDVELYSAWIDGKIVFRHTTFNEIIKILERHYNVDIVNNNKVLGDKFFTANFDIETIDQVLKSFNENYSITYSIKNNQVIIN